MKYIKNNFFVSEVNDSESRKHRTIIFANKLLQKIGINYQLNRTWADPTVDMNTLAHRINFYHLLTSVVENNIPGDVIELGTYLGQSALVFQETLDTLGSDKKLHLYDSFEMNFIGQQNVEQILIENFKRKKLRMPVIHKGLFNDTLPHELPDRISFAHIDCGIQTDYSKSNDHSRHIGLLQFCLTQIYERMSSGAICVLMDYHDPDLPGRTVGPGVKIACDLFFKDKPEEKIVCLYAQGGCHAYFKKL